jgi:hypothetical protein
MKHLAVVMLVTLGLTLGACGGGSNSGNSGNISGNWTATLTNPDGTPAFAFTTSFSQNSGNSTVNVTNLDIDTSFCLDRHLLLLPKQHFNAFLDSLNIRKP